jgi:hypothetical protein
MKLSLRIPFLVFALGLGACMMRPQGQTPPPQQPLVSDEQKDAVRKQEAAAEEMEAKMGNQEEEQIAKAETDLTKAVKVALGKEAMNPGMPMPETSSNAVKAIRDAKIKMRIEQVTDQNGKPVANNFLQLKDSFTDRVQQLSKKISEQKASKAEMKEIQDGAKHVAKLNDLKQQVLNISMATMTSNNTLQTSSMTTMLRVAGLVRTRKQMEMQMNDEDYARVAKWLTRQRRIEQTAAVSMGILATYQGVINDDKNPQALDVLCEKVATSFPEKPTVTTAEAKDYVKNLKGNVTKVKGEYEAMLRKVHGDAKYDAQFKGGIDAMFAQAESAEKQKSVTEMAADTNAKYKEDIGKCARGEAISPGSLVSPPRCKQVREASLRGEPIPDSLDASNAAPEASSGGDGILGMLPGFNIIKASIEGVTALAKGDAKGALNAAVGLVPGGGPLRDTFTQVSRML